MSGQEYLVGDHDCINCGACCASFRVSFYWGETDQLSSEGVPESLTEKLNHHRVAMRGTNQKNPYCIALQGAISQQVSCAIYQHRPSPCREFVAGSERCLEVRARHGITLPQIEICA